MDRFDDLIKSKIVADLDEESLLHLEQVGGAFSQLVKMRIREIEESEDFPDIGTCCRERRLISLRHHTRLYNYGLYGACDGGHLDICNLMIENGADDWDGGLYNACQGGHLDICNFMIAKGAKNWTESLRGACWGGNLEVINLMINHGGDINWGLYGACEGGHLDICNLMIEKGANDLDYGLFFACDKKHSDICKLMIAKIGNIKGKKAKKITHCMNCDTALLTIFD